MHTRVLIFSPWTQALVGNPFSVSHSFPTKPWGRGGKYSQVFDTTPGFSVQLPQDGGKMDWGWEAKQQVHVVPLCQGRNRCLFLSAGCARPAWHKRRSWRQGKVTPNWEQNWFHMSKGAGGQEMGLGLRTARSAKALQSAPFLTPYYLVLALP